MVKAFVYGRVSTKEQGNAQHGHVSLEAQLSFCKSFISRKGWSFGGSRTETYSARDMNKLKVLNQLLADMNDGDILVFYNVSRFSRNTAQALSLVKRLEARGVTLVSAMEDINMSTAFGRHTLRSLLSNAEYESDLISERVRRSLAFHRELGSHMGAAPYGKKIEKVETQYDGRTVYVRKLVVDSAEKKVINFILEARAGELNSTELTALMRKISRYTDPIEFVDVDGTTIKKIKDKLTASEIANLLNDYGVTRRGKNWTSTTVTRVLDENVREKPTKAPRLGKAIVKRRDVRSTTLSRRQEKQADSDSEDESMDTSDSDTDELVSTLTRTKLAKARSIRKHKSD